MKLEICLSTATPREKREKLIRFLKRHGIEAWYNPIIGVIELSDQMRELAKIEIALVEDRNTLRWRVDFIKNGRVRGKMSKAFLKIGGE